MKLHVLLGVVSTIVLISSDVFGGNSTCTSIGSSDDLLRCIQNNSPSLRVSEAKVEAAKALHSLGSQIQNPEIEGGYTEGETQGDEVVEKEIKISQEIEMGGKRDARLNNARARLELSSARYGKNLADLTIRTVLVLTRLRQIEEEIEFLQEAFSTYELATIQYRKRKALSPENQVALNVFELAQSQSKAQKQLLLEEKRALVTYVELASGQSYSDIVKYLPKHKIRWPNLPSVSEKLNLVSPDIMVALSELNVSNTEVEIQKSKSWSNITVAPTFKQNATGSVSYNTYGISFSFALPVWNRNAGGRALANKKRAVAELEFKNREVEVEKNRLAEVASYKSLVRNINESPLHSSIENKHKKIEKLFKRGLVSSSLIIEAHRQIIDFIKGNHEQELMALKALWTIYAIDGELLAKKLSKEK